MSRKLLLLLHFEIPSLVFTIINFHCTAQIARAIHTAGLKNDLQQKYKTLEDVNT